MAAGAGAHGLVAALGNCGEVGMAGLTLGGGYSNQLAPHDSEQAKDAYGATVPG